MDLPIFIFIKQPCKDHFLVLTPKAKNYGGYCPKCGWKMLGGGWYLPPVKYFNKYFFHDH